MSDNLNPILPSLAEIDAAMPNVAALTPVPAGMPQRALVNAVLKNLRASILVYRDETTGAPMVAGTGPDPAQELMVDPAPVLAAINTAIAALESGKVSDVELVAALAPIQASMDALNTALGLKADGAATTTALASKLDDTQATLTGLSVLGAVDQAAGRTALGLGTASTSSAGDFAPSSSVWTLEQIQDAVAAMFQAGTQTNLSVAYNDAAGTLSLSATGGGAPLTQEQVEDMVGSLLQVSGTGINVTYNDAGNILTIALSGESYTTAEKNKLAGIAAGATTNATNAELRDRATHTGEQPVSSVTGLEAALLGKISASTAITVTAKAAPMAAGDTLLGGNSEAAGVPVTFTRSQIAAGVMAEMGDVTATKARLELADELPAFNNAAAGASITTTPAQLKALVRQAWAIPGTCVIAGDSRAAQGFVDATLTVGTYAGQHTTRNTWSWVMGLLGHPLRLTQSAGVGGDTLAMFVARQNNVIGGSLFGAGTNPGWTAYRPEFLFVDLGINDVLNNGTISLATSLAGARQILDAAQAMGTTVVWPNEYPEGPAGTAMSAASETRRLDWNTTLKALETEYPCLWVPDVSAAMRNPAGGKLWPGLVSDTTGIHVHLNNAGAKMRAEAIAAYIAPLFALRKPMVLAQSSTDLFTLNPACNQYQVNPNLATGATVADVLQSAVSFGAGATGTATLIPDPEGYGQAIQIDVTYTGASSAYALVTFKASQASFAGGECIVGASRVRLGLPGGAAGQLAAGVLPAHMVRCPEATLLVTDAVSDGGIAHQKTAFALNANDAGITGGLEYTAVTPDHQLRPGAPQLVQNQLWLRGIGAGSGAVRWIVSRPTIRRIPRRSDVVSALG